MPPSDRDRSKYSFRRYRNTILARTEFLKGMDHDQGTGFLPEYRANRKLFRARSPLRGHLPKTGQSQKGAEGAISSKPVSGPRDEAVKGRQDVLKPRHQTGVILSRHPAGRSSLRESEQAVPRHLSLITLITASRIGSRFAKYSFDDRAAGMVGAIQTQGSLPLPW